MLTLGFLLKANANEAAEALEALSLKTEAITAGLQGQFASASRQITNSLISTLPVFGMVAGGVAAVGGAIFEMANKASEAGEQLSLASKATGVSVEALQGLKLGAMEVGVSFEQVQRGIAHLSLAMSSLETAGSPASKALKELGIATHDANGHLKSMDELLPSIFDAFQKMPDGPEKTAIAVELFSRAGFQMIPLLDKGAKGLEELTKAGVKNSGITTELAHKDEQFQERLKLLKDQLHGVAQQLGQATVPAVISLGEFLLKVYYELVDWGAALTIVGGKMHEFELRLIGMKDAANNVEKSLQSVRQFMHDTADAYRKIGKETGQAEKSQKALADEVQDSSEKLSDLRKAAEEAFQAAHGKMTPAVLEAVEAYRKAAAQQKILTDALDMTAEKEAELAKRHAEEAAALLRAQMDAHGYTEQLEAMKKVMEEIARTEERRAEAIHKAITESIEMSKKQEPGGMIQMQGDSLSQVMSVFHTQLPTITQHGLSAKDAINGLAQAVQNMSGTFGKSAPMMNTFSEALQRVAERNKTGTSFAEAFLNVQRQQGETAKQAGVSMAASYGMEAASFIKNKRAQAIVMSMMETAKAFSEVFWNPAAAALDFASAAMYGVIAGVSGGSGSSGAGGGGVGGGATQPGAGGQGVTGGGLLSGGSGGGGNYHQTVVNLYGGAITDTNNLQRLATAFNLGSSTGTVRLNVSGTSATIPTPAY